MPANARNLTTIALTCVMAVLLCLAQTASAVATRSLEKTASGNFFADPGFCTGETAPETQQLQWEIDLATTQTASGRQDWLSADPIGEGGGMNLYAYCYGNPLVFRDPDGRFPSAAWWGGFFDFDQGTVDALKLGAMATADGFIPFSDPFQLSGGYSGCEDGVGFSKAAGAISRDAAIMATGLPLAGSKRFVPPGAASGTNAARLVFRRLTLGAKLSKGVRTPVGFPFVNLAWPKTPKIAGILGRYWPYYAGGGAAISDAMDLNSSRDCP